MSGMKGINLALRFALELCALAALAFWGFKTQDSLLGKIVLGLGAPLLVAVLWGLFVAPRRRFDLPGWARLVIEWLVWIAAVAGLWTTGQSELATLFLAVLVVNQTFLALWNQRAAQDEMVAGRTSSYEQLRPAKK